MNMTTDITSNSWRSRAVLYSTHAQAFDEGSVYSELYEFVFAVYIA